MPEQLLVTEGPDKGRVFHLEAGEALLLGRSPGLPHPLSDPAIGLAQCQVEDVEGRLELTEIHPSGGTSVNGRPAGTARLNPGDVIAIGETRLTVRRAAGRADANASGMRPAARGGDPIAALVGSRLSHYRLDRLMIRGATGALFAAQDVKYRRQAVVKVLYPQLTADKTARERFVRTMRLMLPIRHPNLVTLYSAGTTDGLCWAAMEYVDGESAAGMLARLQQLGASDWPAALRLGIHIARALEAADIHNIVHRNVTAPNILIRAGDHRALLGDLMLATSLQGGTAAPAPATPPTGDEIAYAAPERLLGQKLDIRADIYGLGVVMYGLAAGRLPHPVGRTPAETVSRILNEPITPPRKWVSDISEPFAAVLAKMLAKDPDARFLSPGPLLTELEVVAKLQGWEPERI